MKVAGKVSVYWNKHVSKVPRSLVLGASLTFVMFLLFFKAKPYLADNPEVKPFVRESDRSSQKADSSRIAGVHTLAGGDIRSTRSGARGGNGGSGNSLSRSAVPKVLERPLFDGKNVTLKVQLTTALDSSSGDTSVEGRVIGVIDPDQSGSVDSATVKSATIRGSSTPNFEAKRYMAQFSEILSPDGKSIPISGVAYNLADSSIGIPSDYSSGLPSRIIGSAINRVIVAADAVAENRILSDGSDSPVDRELSRVASQGSSETANGIGDEASKGLRETKAVLKVSAGSIVYVKMQSHRSPGGVR